MDVDSALYRSESEVDDNSTAFSGTRESPTPIRSVPCVQLVLTDNDGHVRGIVPIGENAPLAHMLAIASEIEDYPVTKNEDNSFALGQDLYSVSRSFVMRVCGVFFSQSWRDLDRLEQSIPRTVNCTFCVVK